MLTQRQVEISFDERFIDRYAGALLEDTLLALVELVANAWDAGATQVDITWPSPERGRAFMIRDNGHGMTPDQFEGRFCSIEYDRTREQGREVEFPPDVALRRLAYGKNGKGRLSGFRFSDPFRVVTTRDGVRSTYLVGRGSGKKPLNVREGTANDQVSQLHGTQIEATVPTRVAMTAEDARQAIGLRFLADPSFTVTIDGAPVDFDDIPRDFVQRTEIPIPGHGSVKMYVVDTQKSDRSSKQHGIAWRVNNRLVGNCDWSWTQGDRRLDRRTRAARRLTFIIVADLLEEAVRYDWAGFREDKPVWPAAREAVFERIKEVLSSLTAEERAEAREEVREAHEATVVQMGPVGRDKWTQFVDEVLLACPTLGTRDLTDLAGILAKLELANSRYGILRQMQSLAIGDLDNLHIILDRWGVDAAKTILDELEWRLRLIKELTARTQDHSTLEVQELQPLMEQCLWMFGPEYDIIEYTSNEAMTSVIAMLSGNSRADSRGTRNRPDFVVTPGGTAGCYTYPRYDDIDGQIGVGVGRLVIVELKKPGVPIGNKEKQQPWKYTTELYDRGLLKKGRDPVQAYILGTTIAPNEEDSDVKAEGTVRLTPMLYDTLLARAHSRTFHLYNQVRTVPSIADNARLSEIGPSQRTLDFRPAPFKRSAP